MSEKDIDKTPNNKSFLSRGCSCTPAVEGENTNFYKSYCCKLDEHNWLDDIKLPTSTQTFDCVEVRFKNSRKSFFRLQNGTEVSVGDIVAVEASPGHEIGIVSMVGEAVKLQMKRRNVKPNSEDIKKLSFEGSYSDACQEYAEAIFYYDYVKDEKIPTPKELKINHEDYLMGLCDLTGELTRRAVRLATKKKSKECD